MGRKKIYSDQEREERVLQQKREYYYRNKEKIAERYKLWRLKKLGIIESYDEPVPNEKSPTDVLKEWNGQLYQHLQTNLSEWLEIGLNKQIELNSQFINLYEQKQGKQKRNNS